MIYFQIFCLLCSIFVKDVSSGFFPDFEESNDEVQNIEDEKARFLKITNNNDHVSSMKLLKTIALLHGVDVNLPVGMAGPEVLNHQDEPQNNTVFEEPMMPELKEALQIVYMRFLSFKLFTEMFHCTVHFFVIPNDLLRNEGCLGAMASILKFHIEWRANEKIEKFPKLHEIAMELDASKLRSAIKSIFDFLETRNEVIPELDEVGDIGIENVDVESSSIQFLDDINILYEPLNSLIRTTTLAVKYFKLVLRAPVTDPDKNVPIISRMGLPSLWDQIVELATYLEPTEADDGVSFEKMRIFVFENLILKTQLSKTNHEPANFEVIPKSKRYTDFTVVF